jgi:hypothetical protein
MIRPRKRKRLTRKNNAKVQTLDCSFVDRDGGTDVEATYGTDKIVITTRFNKILEYEDQMQVNSAFVHGYTFRQFKKDCPELAESCEGWVRPRKAGSE